MHEAARVLRPGGRLVMMEPAITLLSRPIYTWFHAEPVVMTADPFTERRPEVAKDPFDGNQAIPTLMMRRFRERTLALNPDFDLISDESLSLWCYPLSGGGSALEPVAECNCAHRAAVGETSRAVHRGISRVSHADRSRKEDRALTQQTRTGSMCFRANTRGSFPAPGRSREREYCY